MKCKRHSDGRALDHHTLQMMRQQAIKAVREGQTVQSVAAAYGVNERSVFRWLANFASGGQSALLAKPIPGRPSKLSAEELSWIANTVRDHNCGGVLVLTLRDTDKNAEKIRENQRLSQKSAQTALAPTFDTNRARMRKNCREMEQNRAQTSSV